MKHGYFGIYQGREYAIYLHSNDTVDLLLDAEEEGFSKRADGRFFRSIKQRDLNSAYLISPMAKYSGVEVAVRPANTKSEVIIVGESDYDKMVALGFDEVERGVFEKRVKLTELDNFRERRDPVPLRK